MVAMVMQKDSGEEGGSSLVVRAVSLLDRPRTMPLIKITDEPKASDRWKYLP